MADIFLSYAHEDQQQARMLADLLAGFGWTVFWDREILAGSVFDDVIQQELDQTKCVMCLWSVHSVTSQWVRAEAEEGANRNMLVSVLIEDVRLPIAFRRIQAAQLFGWTGAKEDERLKDVLKAVKFVVDKPPQGQENGAGASTSRTTAAGQPGSFGTATAAAPVEHPIPTATPVTAAATASTRSPLMIGGIIAGVLVLGGSAWLLSTNTSGKSPQANVVSQPGNTPSHGGGTTPAANTAGGSSSSSAVPDEELLVRAREIGEALGHGKVAVAREQFTTELQASPAATQWRQRLKSLGPLVAVEAPKRTGGSGDLRDVRVVMKHQNESVEALLTFVPDGKVCGFATQNSTYRAGCK